MADAPQTAVVRVERRVVLRVDQLRTRAHRRLGQLQWTLEDLGRAMGVSRQRVQALLQQREMTEEAFERLSVALRMGWADWHVPLPAAAKRPVYAELRKSVRERLRRIRDGG